MRIMGFKEKRIMIKVTTVLAVILLTATTALAVVGTTHDFSLLGGNPCSYCHSIHNAAGALGRPSYMDTLPSIIKVYSSISMDHTPTISILNNSDAPLCLTCHDETTITNFAAGGDPAAVTVRDKIIANPSANIGLDLSNDHPVGFIYNAALDPEIKAPSAPVNVVFGLGLNEMWCSTCHNVHGGVAGTKFLVMSNDSSSLCFACHIK